MSYLFVKVASRNLDSAMLEELSTYLETLTTAGGKELNQDILKKVKNICKVSEENVTYAFHVIMVQLNKDHAEIRYGALLVINELFKRSHVFRKLLLSEFQEFLELTAETDQEYPLPPPKTAAKNLRIKTLELVQQWNDQFGEDYKRLKLGYNFLRDCKKVDFANLHARSVIAQRRELEAQRKQAKIIQDKVNKVSLEMSEKTPEINNVLKQMENCFCLLLPSFDNLTGESDLNLPSTSKQITRECDLNLPSTSKQITRESDLNLPSTSKQITFVKTSISLPKNDEEISKTVEKEERKDMLRHHGLHGVVDNFNIEITINPYIQMNNNTQDIIDNLKDLYRQAEKCFLPSVGKWIHILTKGSNCTAFLKKAINLKNSLLAATEKFKELKILPNLNDEEGNSGDDDDFEIVEEKEGYEASVPSHLKTECGIEAVTATKTPVKHVSEEIKDPTSYEFNISAYHKKLVKNVSNLHCTQSSNKSGTLDHKKANILSQAPRVPYDIDLYHWEDEKIEPPSVIKFDSQHKFWKPNENETTEIQDKEAIAALRMRKIDFVGKFIPVKWKCHAPLPSGKLCPRQDRYKCPFHGIIIARDEAGNPKDKKDAATSETVSKDIPEWQDPEFLRDLEASIGIDLKIPKKRGKKDASKKSTTKRRKYPNLTDINREQNTTRRRLEKKLFKKESLEKIADELNESQRKKHDDKFGNQWVYTFNS